MLTGRSLQKRGVKTSPTKSEEQVPLRLVDFRMKERITGERRRIYFAANRLNVCCGKKPNDSFKK